MSAMLDSCDGDSAGLLKELGDDYTVIFDNSDDYGYGHHSYDTIYKTSDGRFIHAECGGCSCDGSGSWDYVDEATMMQYVPEYKRGENYVDIRKGDF